MSRVDGDPFVALALSLRPNRGKKEVVRVFLIGIKWKTEIS